MRGAVVPLAEGLVSINNLTPYIQKWTVKARVTSKGDMRTFTNMKGEGKLFNFELIDADVCCLCCLFSLFFFSFFLLVLCVFLLLLYYLYWVAQFLHSLLGHHHIIIFFCVWACVCFC